MFVHNDTMKITPLVRIYGVRKNKNRQRANIFHKKGKIKMLKRIVSTVIAITIVMGMAACSQQNDNGSKNKSAQSASFVLADDVAQPTANIEFKKADTSDSSEFDKGFISSVNGFSVELFKRTAKQELEYNSPVPSLLE